VPPPSAAPKLSAAELEKLLMPIALYPDPLLATLLPASVYPLEVVQAQRFIQDTNNIANIDQQPWDDSVKALARIPEALKKLNEDLDWTIQLGEAFLNQDKDVTDTIQALRLKASTAGTLKTSEQQTIVVTNMVTEKTVEQQVVVVTNTVVQIQPSNPEVVYVPSYPPTVYAPPPSYVADPYAPLITFAAGAAMGAIIANNVDWNDGGCYWGGGGGYHGDIDIDNDVNIDMGDRNTAVRTGDRNNVQNVQGGNKQKWQPDQNRVRASGTAASTRSMESRGYSSGRTGTGTTAARATPQYTGASRPQGQAAAANRPAGAQAGSGAAAARAQGSAAGVSSASGARADANRPAAQSSGAAARPSNPSSGGGAARSAAASPSNASAGSRSGSGGGSAFSGGGANQQQAYSNRGSASRSGGGGGGGGAARGGGGGGSRGGGGRR
jgi:hypothetical protein